MSEAVMVSNFECDSRPSLTVEVTHGDELTLMVTVEGEVDMATASQLQKTVIDAIDRHPTRHVIVDGDAMPFLDAAGITALIGIYRHAAARHADVRLVNVRPRVAYVLRLAGLVDVLQVSPIELDRED